MESLEVALMNPSLVDTLLGLLLGGMLLAGLFLAIDTALCKRSFDTFIDKDFDEL